MASLPIPAGTAVEQPFVAGQPPVAVVRIGPPPEKQVDEPVDEPPKEPINDPEPDA